MRLLPARWLMAMNSAGSPIPDRRQRLVCAWQKTPSWLSDHSEHRGSPQSAGGPGARVAAVGARVDVLGDRLLEAARGLAGARVLAAGLYGGGPVTALAMPCWLGGAGRFSSSRKAVRFAGLAGEGGLAGLPGLAVAGLSGPDARALLASVIPGRLDERVRDRIIAESGGNPLALLELPRGLSPAELAGGFGVAGSAPLAGRIEQSFRRRIAPLPEATRR